MYKLKIAVLFGGCSEEHDVSVKSAMEVAANINKEKYQPFYIGITKSGAWKLCDKLPGLGELCGIPGCDFSGQKDPWPADTKGRRI